MKQKLNYSVIDKPVFLGGAFVCLLFIAWTVIAPRTVESVFASILSTFTSDFGWLYLVVVSFFIVFLLYLALSRYGKIRLGEDNEKPEYSTFSWFFMLFAAGMGIGLVFWGAAEPLSHYLNPALAEGGTTEAATAAMKAAFTHWGIHPWAIYGIFGLPMAYYGFRKGKPALLSTCIEPIVGEKNAKGILGKVVDILAVIATVFGVATSLGLGAMQVNSGLHYIFGIPYNNAVMFGIIAVTTVLFISSAVSGIDKGIKALSDFNMFLMAILILFVLFAGSTLFVADFFVDSFGQYVSSLISTSFWTDPFRESNGWLHAWTVFYWAWWLSWGPFVGGFIARISRGRTIREFVIGTMLFPMLLCFVFMTVMGGNAIHMDMQGITDIAAALNENVSYALFAMLDHLPLSMVTSVLAMFLVMVFFITSADSSTFVCASMTTHGVQNPPGSIKILWGICEGVIAAILLYVGGLSAVQSVSIAIGFPLLFVCLLIAAALLKSIRSEFPNP